MQAHQLIITVLGPNSIEALSDLTATISKQKCNILDSRHAQYGTDFSLTMIVAGNQASITALELALSAQCVEHDLLCMMKRTSGHQKQNIEQLIQLTFSGHDDSGLIYQVLQFLAKHNVIVNAIRQKTKTEFVVDTQATTLQCKMVLLAPSSCDLKRFDNDLIHYLDGLGLHGNISHDINKEKHEYSESW